MDINRDLHNHMGHHKLRPMVAHLLIMLHSHTLNNTVHQQIFSKGLHNMPSPLRRMAHLAIFLKGPLNTHRNEPLLSVMDLQSLAPTAVLRRPVPFNMALLKTSHTMHTQILSSNTVTMALRVLKVLMQMARIRIHLIPTVLLFSLRMVTFLLVKILAMSVRGGHTATDPARLNISSKMRPKTRPRPLLRMTLTNLLKASVGLKTKINKKIFHPNSRIGGTAARQGVPIQSIVMEQIVPRTEALH
jgi:hypothetical protein